MPTRLDPIHNLTHAPSRGVPALVSAAAGRPS